MDFNIDAEKRRYYFNIWFDGLRDILAMFDEYKSLFLKDDVVMYVDSNCQDNKVLYIVIKALVSEFLKGILGQQEYVGRGDKALAMIKTKCAAHTEVDKHFYHQKFTDLRCFKDEIITNFLKRFTIGRMRSEQAGSIYSENQLVDCFLSALSGIINTNYIVLHSAFMQRCKAGETIHFVMLEQAFMSIDEETSRESRTIRNVRASAHFVSSMDNQDKKTTYDLSKTRCYNCDGMGHLSRDCKKPRRPRSASNDRKPTAMVAKEAGGIMKPSTRYPSNGRNNGSRSSFRGKSSRNSHESDPSVLEHAAATSVHFFGCATRVVGLPEGGLSPQFDCSSIEFSNSIQDDVASISSEEVYETSGNWESLQQSDDGISNGTPYLIQRSINQFEDLRSHYSLANDTFYGPHPNPDSNDSREEETGPSPDISGTITASNSVSSGTVSLIDGLTELHFASVALPHTTETDFVQANYSRVTDPSLDEIGDPHNLTNWLMDSGATAHMTPRFADLEDVEEGLNLGVEVADGHVVHCNKRGKIRVIMTDDNGDPLHALVHDCLYVPGLSRRLFSVTTFANLGHQASIQRNAVILYFGEQQSPITIPMLHGLPLATNVRVNAAFNLTAATSRHNPRFSKHRVDLEDVARRLGLLRIHTIIAAADHGVGGYVSVRMQPFPECVSVRISTIRAKDRIKHHTTSYTYVGQQIFYDVLPKASNKGITPNSTFTAMVIMVDAFSRFLVVFGLPKGNSTEVINSFKQFKANLGRADSFHPMSIRADAGSQFTSLEFRNFCRDEGINLSLAAPKQQWQNHYAERMWQTINSTARAMLVHARAPDCYKFHAVVYATAVFNILPVGGLYDKDGQATSPHELMTGRKAMIADFRVFGCPAVAKKWKCRINGKDLEKQTQRGIRCVFLGFPANQRGYLLYVPASREIVVSGDVLFDETFASAIATTWKPFHDSLTLRPKGSAIPDPNTLIESTGTVASVPTFDEGNEEIRLGQTSDNFYAPLADDDDAEADLDMTDDGYQSEIEQELFHSGGSTSEVFSEAEEESDNESQSPQVVDDSTARRTTGCTRKPPQCLIEQGYSAWRKIAAHISPDVELIRACAAEVNPNMVDCSVDPSRYMPAPNSIRNVQKMKDPEVKKVWLKAYHKEIKVLIDSGTFSIEQPQPGEPVVPTMETNKVKLKSDGSLDKLKCRIVVRGDLQNKQDLEDKWSPTTSFRAMKMFLADASQNNARVWQLDFIGAFLQAKTRSRIFIKLPAVYGELFPDVKRYAGVPLRLVNQCTE